MSDGMVTKEVRTLSILFSIYGWVGSVFSLFVGGYFLLMVRGVPIGPSGAEPQPEAASMAEANLARIDPSTLILVVVGLALLWPMVYVVIGSCLKRGKAKWLAYVGAVLALFNIPLGLALGIYTFVVLGKAENQQGFA